MARSTDSGDSVSGRLTGSHSSSSSASGSSATGSHASGSKKSAESIPEIELDVARTREEFAATLDALEDRLNPKTQLRRARASVKKRVSDDPKVLAVAAVGAAGLAAVVAGAARFASRGSR